MQMIKMIVQLRRQLLARERTYIRYNKMTMQKARDHWCMIGGEQAPCRMAAALSGKLLIIHRYAVRGLLVSHCSTNHKQWS
ncbi:hypothetical protein HDE71_005565 [Janthinobacterium sp. S3M3]|nr:hypothetical protein [Janthinobacterium sp. S3T4]MBB5616480.1 hypothetical protein [Janthinobacterium sp. S3M3]